MRLICLAIGLLVLLPTRVAFADPTEVTLAVPEGQLAATLLLPDGGGPWPAVLILSDSGPVDRDGNLARVPGKTNSLRQLAEELAARGVASLRSDKRGVGGSESAAISENKKRFHHLINDAVLWTNLLQNDDRFSSVSIVGHGQGSLVGMNAAWQAGADGFVSLAGNGRPILDVLRDQLHDSLSIRSRVKAEAVISELEAGRLVPEPPTEMTILFRPTVQEFLISWQRHDPRRDLARLSCPVTIIQGLNDLQVSGTDAQLLQEAKPNATKLLLPGVTHVFKTVESDSPLVQQTALADPDLKFSPEAAAAVLALTEEAGKFHRAWNAALDRAEAANSDGWGLPFQPYENGGLGYWAKFQDQESTRYLFGLAEGGYVEQGRLILDTRHDCVSFLYRCTELARANDYRGNLAWALRTRFAGAHPDSVVGADGRVDYNRPEHLDFSLDMIRSGIWGRDVSAEVGAEVIDSLGTSRYPAGSFAWVPADSLDASKLRGGDVVWFVLNPANKKARSLRDDYGLVIGHIGILSENREDGKLVLYHAASKDLPGEYKGGRIASVDLGTYLKRVERYAGVMVTRQD
jgi:uncharacterized protein